jgi:hypothetical protein
MSDRWTRILASARIALVLAVVAFLTACPTTQA